MGGCSRKEFETFYSEGSTSFMMTSFLLNWDRERQRRLRRCSPGWVKWKEIFSSNVKEVFWQGKSQIFFSYGKFYLGLFAMIWINLKTHSEWTWEQKEFFSGLQMWKSTYENSNQYLLQTTSSNVFKTFLHEW